MQAMTRAWYRTLDFMQKSEFGQATMWVAPRLLRVVWLVIKLSFVVTAVTFVIVYGMLFVCLMALTGNGGDAMKSVTKITLGLLAFVAVKKIADDGTIAKVFKSIGK